MITVREIVDKTRTYFASKGIQSARLDSEVLLGHVLKMDRLKLYMNLDRPLSEAELAAARELVRRRAAREPVAYITGRKEFYSRDFAVGPGVLVPRPETEFLVEAVIKELPRRFPEAGSGVRILEFGAGSGIISITLAMELVSARCDASEISTDAAAFAARNAEAHGVSDRVTVYTQANLAGLEPDYHVLVSNPPYIDPADKPTLEDDVVKFEPLEALFAEERGLAWYRYLITEGGPLVRERGFLAFELGAGQAREVSAMAEAAGWATVRVIKDYSGHERVLLLGRADEVLPDIEPAGTSAVDDLGDARSIISEVVDP